MSAAAGKATHPVAQPLIDPLSCASCGHPIPSAPQAGFHESTGISPQPLAVGLLCGCAWHPDCKPTTGGCTRHSHIRGRFPIGDFLRPGVCNWCLASGTASPCAKCSKQMGISALRQVNDSMPIKDFYVAMMKSIMWPSFFGSTADRDDVDHDGTPMPHMHTLMEVAWRDVRRQVAASPLRLVFHDRRVIKTGAWIEQDIAAMPARSYSIQVVTITAAYRHVKTLVADPTTIIDAFRLYLRETPGAKIALLRPTVVRKKTSLNLCSAEDLAHSLIKASYTGLKTTDVYKESNSAQQYITALGDRVVVMGDRLYWAARIQPVAGLTMSSPQAPEPTGPDVSILSPDEVCRLDRKRPSMRAFTPPPCV